ncbi:MAG: PAS domain S-box protein, partial [Acidobacteriaceae bacterium]
EMAIRESEQTYRALFEGAGDAIMLTDLEGKILRANQKTAELLEYDQSELEALSILDLTIAEEHVDVKKNMEWLKEGTRLPPYIRHYLKKSGMILPTENNTVLVMDAHGNPKYFQNIVRDITERLRAEQAQRQLIEEIRQSNEQMRDLAVRIQAVQELERQELATVLHDRVGQNLTGLNLNLKILQDQMRGEADPETHKRLDDSLKMVEETTHQIRDVMADLNPPVLDEYGFWAAIKWYCGDFSNRTGITTHVSGKKFDPPLASHVEKVLFRLVQESLNNIAKHAQASRVMVNVKSSKDVVSVTVQDNGKGFDPRETRRPTAEPHWGLLSMQQRAASIGGTLAIESSPGMGTQVSVMIRRN